MALTGKLIGSNYQSITFRFKTITTAYQEHKTTLVVGLCISLTYVHSALTSSLIVYSGNLCTLATYIKTLLSCSLKQFSLQSSLQLFMFKVNAVHH